MNRKVILIRLVSILLMAFMVVITLVCPVLADDPATGITAKDALKVTQFDDKSDNSGAAGSVQNIIGAIITIARVIGIGVAIIMLVVLAIKYISAAPAEKAEIKKSATLYIVGAIVLFAASSILGIIQNFAGNVSAGG